MKAAIPENCLIALGLWRKERLEALIAADPLYVEIYSDVSVK